MTNHYDKVEPHKTPEAPLRGLLVVVTTLKPGKKYHLAQSKTRTLCDQSIISVVQGGKRATCMNCLTIVANNIKLYR